MAPTDTAFDVLRLRDLYRPDPERLALARRRQAAVWRGGRNLSVEKVPVPAIKDGEILVQVAACGLCPTDIKKIDLGLVPPPVILGHEFSGRVVSAGRGATHLSGRRVAALVSGSMKAGSHQVTWAGRDDSGRPVASGVYFYRLEAENKVLTRKMVLLK